jgi:hypothetical protein
MNLKHRRWPWPILLLALPYPLGLVLLVMHAGGHYSLMDALTADKATNLFTATSGAAGALLGLVITTLAILVAFPDRPAANRLRIFTGWTVLQYCLLVTALILLVATLLGTANDSYLLRDLLVAFGTAVAAGILVSGILFALLLLNLAITDADAMPTTLN